MLRIFEVTIILRPRKDDWGRGSRYFPMKIEAESEEQALDFGKQMFEGFLAQGVTIETRIGR